MGWGKAGDGAQGMKQAAQTGQRVDQVAVPPNMDPLSCRAGTDPNRPAALDMEVREPRFLYLKEVISISALLLS